MLAMAGRRILLFVVLLLVVAAGAEAIAPRDEAPRAVKPPPSAGPPPRVVEGELPADDELRARVGDIVQLTVTNRTTDIVRVVALGLEAPVEPELPAEIVFDADRPGRFSVTLRDAQRRVGVIEVLPES
jgi:hypothetical protein